jgi:hypothetical protein
MVAISRNGDEPGFRGMLVLMMTSPGSYQKPTVVFKHPNDLADLHCLKIDGVPGEVNHGQSKVARSCRLGDSTW